jgi:hypothetical protein
MAIYDPRLDLARSQAERVKSPSVQTLKSVMQQQGLGLATTNTGQTDWFAEAAQKAAPEPGGWKGVLLDIMDSPLGKVVTEGGKIISIPGKIVTSGIQEFTDIFNNDPNATVSFNDFTKQVSDPTFGFGSVIGDLTGIKWIDRGLGFAGDVLTDPLTYLTLGGSKAIGMLDDAGRLVSKEAGKRIGARITGEGGRFALAERLASLGASPQVQKAAIRYGRAGVKDVELLSKAGVDRAGLYFMGKRISGTTRVAEKLEKGFAGMRIWSGDHIFGKIGDAFTRADANEAILALRRGTAPADEIAEYLHFVNSRNIERSAEAAGAREASQAEINLLGTIAEADIKAARSTAYKYIDQADTVVPDVGSAEGRIVGPIKQWFKEMHDNVFRATKAVDPDAPIGEIDNYLPHIHTDDAFRWMADESNAVAVATRGTVYNPLDPASAWKRRMVEGDLWFGEPLTAEDIAGGLDRLNVLGRERGNLKFDFFETDLPTIMDKYTKMYGAQMGKIARKQYLKDKGVFQKVEERLIEDPAWVKSAEKRIATVTKERAKALAKVNKKLGEATKSLDIVLEQGMKDTRGRLTAALAETDLSARNQSWESSWARKQLLDTLEEAHIELGQHQNALSDLAGRTDGVAAALNAQYAEHMADIQKLWDDVNAGLARDAEITDRIAKLQKNVELITKTEEKTVNRSNIMQFRTDEIKAGVKIKGHQDFANKVENILFGPSRMQGVSESVISGQRAFPGRGVNEVVSPFQRDPALYKQAQGRVKRSYKGDDKGRSALLVKLEYKRLHYDKYGATPAEIAGREEGIRLAKRDEAFLPQDLEVNLAETGYPEGQGIKYFGPAEPVAGTPSVFTPQEWAIINGNNVIDRKRIVEAAKPENMQSIMSKALRGEASMEELRAVGVAFLAGNNDSLTVETRDRLITLLNEASNSVTLQKQLDDIKRNSRGAVKLDNVVSNYTAVQNKVVAGLQQYFGANTILNDIVRMNPDPQAVVPIDLLYKLSNDHPALGAYFSRFLSQDLDYEELMGAFEGTGRAQLGAQAAFDAVNFDDVPTITFGQLEQDLGRVVKNLPDEEYVINIDLSKAAKAGLRNQDYNLENKTVKLSKLIKDYNITLPVEGGTLDLAHTNERLDDFISRVITGKKVVTEDELLKREQDLARGARPKGGRTRRYTGAMIEEAPGDTGGQSLARRIQDIKNMYSRLDSTIVDVDGQKEINRVKRLIANGQATEDDLILVQNQVNRKFYDEVLKPMGFGADVADYQQSLNSLAEMLPIMHFQMDIQQRTSEMVDLFAAQGILPGKDNFLNIVNNVAKQHYGDVGHEMSSLRVARMKITDLIETVSSGDWQGREAELYDLITKEIASPDSKSAGWIDAISRANGRADADRLYKQMQELGVTGTKSGIPNTRAKLTQRLNKDKTLSEAERAAITARRDALPTGPVLKAMRDKFKKEVLRPWYLKNVNSTATKATYKEMAEALKSMKTLKTDVGRLAEDASVSKMKTWLEETYSRLLSAEKTAGKNSEWLRQARDPFLDLNKFTYGKGTAQDLPSTYINALDYSASKLEMMSDELDAMVARVTRRQEALEASMPEEQAAILLAERMQSGKTRGQILTSRVTGAYDEFSPIVNEEELAQLEIIPPEILATLPDEAAQAKYIKKAKADYIAKAELVSKEYLKQEERALQAQRRAFQAYEEAKNTNDYMGAYERKHLDDLLREFAPYSFENTTSLKYRRPSHKIAADLFDQGTPVFTMKSPHSEYQLVDIKNLKSQRTALERQLSDLTNTSGRNRMATEETINANMAQNQQLAKEISSQLNAINKKLESLEGNIVPDTQKLSQLKRELSKAQTRWSDVVVSNSDSADLPYGDFVADPGVIKAVVTPQTSVDLVFEGNVVGKVEPSELARDKLGREGRGFVTNADYATALYQYEQNLLNSQIQEVSASLAKRGGLDSVNVVNANKLSRINDISEINAGGTYFVAGGNIGETNIDEAIIQIDALIKRQNALLKKQSAKKITPAETTELQSIYGQIERINREVQGGVKIIERGPERPLVVDGKEVSFTPDEMTGIFGDNAASRAAIEEEIKAVQYRIPQSAKKAHEFFDSFGIGSAQVVERKGKAVKVAWKDLSVKEKYFSILETLRRPPTAKQYDAMMGKGFGNQEAAELLAIENAKLQKKFRDGVNGLAYYDYEYQLGELQQALLTTDPIYRNAGLQKMTRIIKAIKDGDLTMEEVVDSLGFTSRSDKTDVVSIDSATRKARLKELDKAWTGSKDEAVFNHVAALADDSHVADYHVSIGKSEKARERINNIRLEIEKLKGQFDKDSDAPFGTRRSIGKVSAKIKELEDTKPQLIQDLMQKEGLSRQAATSRVESEIKATAEEAGRVALNGKAKKKVNVKSKRFKNSVQKLVDEEGMEPSEAFNEAFKRAQAYEVDTVAGAQYRYRMVRDDFVKDIKAITDSTSGEYNAMSRMADLREQGMTFIEAKNVIVDEVAKLYPKTWDVASSATSVKNLRDIDFNKSQIGFFERVLSDDANLALYFTRIGKNARDDMKKRIDNLTEQALPIKKQLDEVNAVIKSKAHKEAKKVLEKNVKTTGQKIASLEQTLLEMAQQVDLVQINKMTDAAHRTHVVAPLKDKFDALQQLLARSQSLGKSSDTAEIKRLEFDSLVNDAEELLREYGRVEDKTKPQGSERVRGIMVDRFEYKNTKEYDAFLRVKADYINMHMDYMMGQDVARKAMFALTHDFFDENLGEEIWLDIKDGFTTLEKFGMPNLQARESMIPIITNMSRFRQPEFVRGVNKFLGSYTGFFKAYALSTPGFVVRNVMTNTFSLYAAGAETKNLMKGLGLYRGWQDALKAGTAKTFVDSLPEEEARLFNLAISAADATGYGRSGEAFANWNPKRATLASNKYTRFFRKYNETAEGSSRFMLAYDSAVQGYDMNMAAARVKRYLFDYVDVGRVDESLRGVVPFWFWMSRNLPMQTINRFANPRPYLLYTHLMQNLGQDSEDDIVPKWLRESGGVKLGGDTFFSPDLGFNKMSEQFAMIADPKRLLGYVNPGLRVPLEVLGNTHLNTGVPFRAKAEGAIGGPLSPAVDALAAFMGQQRQMQSGAQGVTPKMNYAMSNLFPPLGQAEGVMPSSERGMENQTNRLMGLFGIPLTIVTPGMKETENRRATLEQNALRNIASGG